MDNPELRRRAVARNRDTIRALSLKALAHLPADEDVIVSVIAADDPTWKPLLDKLNPDWEQKYFKDGKKGTRLLIGTLDPSFVEFMVQLMPEAESAIRKKAPPAHAKVFALCFGGVDMFFIKYLYPQKTSSN
jgi:hypothetical protein